MSHLETQIGSCTRSDNDPTVHRLRAALDQIPAAELLPLPAANDDELYARKVLCDTDGLMIVAARWRAGARCELHSHANSAGLYRIIAGDVEEERFLPSAHGYDFQLKLLRQGSESFLPAGSVHQMRAKSDAITLHAYSPRPADAVSEVNGRALELLHAARQRADVTPQGHGLQFDGAPSLLEFAAELANTWSEHERRAYERGACRLPARVLEDFRNSRILTAPLPVRFGGPESSLWDVAQAVRSVARRAPAAALALVMPLGNAATCRIPLAAVRAEHRAALRLHQSWIAQQVLGGRLLAVANSEPGAGGDLKNTKTVAKTDASGESRLSGRKAFATIGPDADYFLCAARNDERERVEGSICVDAYFVHRDAPGLEIDDRWDPFGMRPTASIGLRLEHAPATQVLGYPGCLEGVSARHWSTLLFSAVFLGIGDAALREGIRAGGQSGWARAKLAEQMLALDAAAGYLEAVCQAEVWPMPRGLLERAQRVKTFVAGAVIQTATLAATISGGRCYSPHHAIYRLLADALAGPLVRPPLAQAMDGLMDRLDSFAA